MMRRGERLKRGEEEKLKRTKEGEEMESVSKCE
jgi:hypothetical protein